MAANSLATSTIVCKKGLPILLNMLAFTEGVNHDYEVTYESAQSEGYSPGQTVLIKKPPRYTWRAGRVAVPQSTVESTIALTLSQGGTELNFTSLDRTLLLQGKMDKVRAAMATVANEIDRQGLDLVRTSVYNAVGTPGTPPATSLAAVTLMAQANQKLTENGGPTKDRQRSLLMSPALNTALVAGVSGMFNSQSKLSENYNTGLYVDAMGFRADQDQNVSNHTNGTQPSGAAANAVNGAGQTGSTLLVNGAAITGTITRGSLFTLAGVFAVNPQSRISNNALQQFVVMADVAAAATSISISPAITPAGAFQNVTASPANNATLTMVSGVAGTSYQLPVLYHRDAFTLASVPMAKPTGNVSSVSQETDGGITMRVVEFYDGVNDNSIMRIDVLYAWAVTYPELACRVYI